MLWLASALIALFLLAVLLRKLRQTESQLAEERHRRISWERAEGLPFWNKQETESALWVRAFQNPDGREAEVLRSLYFEEELSEDFLESFAEALESRSRPSRGKLQTEREFSPGQRLGTVLRFPWAMRRRG